MRRALWGWVALLALPFVAGCDNARDDELRNWMADQRTQARPKIVPLKEPTQFVPQDYVQQNAVDPYSAEKLTQALRRDSSSAASNTALITPELARRKEPLEAFPLDSMAMVGTLVRAGQPVALVRIGTLLYQVRVGDHLGQNFGRVTRITETETTLRELVEDPSGDWVERSASLQLQETSK